MDVALARACISQDMIGKDCLIAVSEQTSDQIKYMQYGETYSGKISGADYRSIEQLNLFWACCQLVSENIDDENWNTKEKVAEQIKIKAKFVESWLYYTNSKTNTQALNIKTKSLSFDKSSHKETCEFMAEAFKLMAEELGITEEALIEEAKLKMQTRHICSKCGRKATQRHHKFPQTKQNRSKYGKIIDDPRNIILYCADCHASHAKLESGDVWNEKTFIEVMGL